MAGRGQPGGHRNHHRRKRHQLPVANLSPRRSESGLPSQPALGIADFSDLRFSHHGQLVFGPILSGYGPSVVADTDGNR